MDWLKEILGAQPEAEGMLEQIKKELPKYFVPKARYNEVAEAKKELEEHLTIANSSKAQYEDSVKAFKKAAVENAVKAWKPKDADLVKLLLNADELSLREDGNLEGLEDKMQLLRTEKPFLFQSEFLEGKTPFGQEEKQAVISKGDFAKMGYKERMELYRQDPEQYELLSETNN